MQDTTMYYTEIIYKMECLLENSPKEVIPQLKDIVEELIYIRNNISQSVYKE